MKVVEFDLEKSSIHALQMGFIVRLVRRVIYQLT